jgi:hypothetical protein
MTEDLCAKVFEDGAIASAWRVEKMDKESGYEAFAIFARPSARQNAIDYSRLLFGEFNEIELHR